MTLKGKEAKEEVKEEMMGTQVESPSPGSVTQLGLISDFVGCILGYLWGPARSLKMRAQSNSNKRRHVLRT